MSDSPPERDVEWTASGAEAAWKHLQRVWRLTVEITEDSSSDASNDIELEKAKNIAIDAVTNGVEGFAFNKSIAALYQFTNILAKSPASKKAKIDAMLTITNSSFKSTIGIEYLSFVIVSVGYKHLINHGAVHI